jgi:hypothetical protein
MEAIDINALVGEKGYSTHERLGIRPCLDVNGIWGGYIEKGAIPSSRAIKSSSK